MSIPVIETGAFDQGGDYSGNGRSTQSNSAGAFTESALHARDASQDIATSWFFPTNFASQSSQNWNMQSNKYFGGGAVAGFPTNGTQYLQGQYCAIFFWNMPNAIDANGNYITVSNSSGSFPDGQYYYFLPINAWTFIPFQQYFGTPWTLNKTDQPVIAIALWGANQMNVMLSVPIAPGQYTGGVGLLSGYSFFDSNGAFVSRQNAVFGTIRFTIIAANLSKELDVTPPGANVSNQSQAPLQNGKDSGGLTPFSIDTTALLGQSMPFYPKIYLSNVPDPGIASSTNGGQNAATCNYGGYWSNSTSGG